MKEGLLWFDDDPARDLAEKVARAVQHYRQKHGEPPDACYVHPSALAGGAREISGVRVMPLANVLRHHFWLGREGAERELPRSLVSRVAAAERPMAPERARHMVARHLAMELEDGSR